MKFIGRGKDCRHQPDRHEQDANLQLQPGPATQRPPEQHRKDCVFGDVTQLAGKEMDLRQGFAGNVRLQPTQEGNQKARRLLG